MSRRWVSLLAVASAGVLGGHLLGYGAGSLLGATTATHHGHLDPLVDVLVPLGSIALVAIALAQPERSGWGRGLTVPRLAGLQSLMYTALEWGERAAQGHGVAELASTPVVAGFVAQLMIAVLVVWAVRLAWRAARPPAPMLSAWPCIVLPLSPGSTTIVSMEVWPGAGARAPPRPLAS